MSFFDDASLVFLPSGQAGKDGKAYSMKPTNGDGDFTFSRGSNLTATRVDSNGLIEKGRENLLLQSNQFDTTWTTSNSSVTSGQSGYDGSSDAWLLSKSGANEKIQQSSISTNGVSTFSVYAKANTSNYIVIRFQSTFAYFDLTTGLSQNETSGIISATSTDIGNGWYRCSIVFNISASSTAYIYPAENGSVSSTSGSIYIQDAQLEIGLTSTEYIESGATTGLAGILEDSPRFDYSGGASCPSLLLEPSRTQLVKFTEYFEGTGWTLGSGSLTNNTTETTSPEGLYNALKMQTLFNNPSLYHSGMSVSASTQYTFSFYAKGNLNTPKLAVYDQSNGAFIVVDVAYTISDDSWTRIKQTITTPVGCTSLRVYPIRGTGNGTIYFWGAQVEEGSYSSSYIPNHSGGSVTRDADDLNDLDISSMLTSSSFTWFLDLNDYIGSDANNINIWIQNTSGVEIQFRVRPDGYRFYYSGIAGGSAYPIAGSTTANKFCVSYDGNDYRLYVDGALEATTRSVGDSGWDKIRNTVLAPLPLKQMLLFPSKLSDAECITLTS